LRLSAFGFLVVLLGVALERRADAAPPTPVLEESVAALERVLQEGSGAGVKERVQAAADKVVTVSELGHALLLLDWSIPRVDEKEVREVEDELTRRFESEFRKTLATGNEQQRIAAVNVIREMFSRVVKESAGRSDTRARNAELRARLRDLTPNYKALTKDPSAEVRVAAANALGTVEGDPVLIIDMLRQLRGDADVGVRRAVAEALANIALVTGQPSTDYLSPGLGTEKEPSVLPGDKARVPAGLTPLRIIAMVVETAAPTLEDRDLIVRRLGAIAARRSAQVVADASKPASDSKLGSYAGGSATKGGSLLEELLRGTDPATARARLENAGVGLKAFRDHAGVLAHAASDSDPVVRLEMCHVFEQLAETARRVRRLEEIANTPEPPARPPVRDRDRDRDREGPAPGRRAARTADRVGLPLQVVGFVVLPQQLPTLPAVAAGARMAAASEPLHRPEPFGPVPSSATPATSAPLAAPPDAPPAAFQAKPEPPAVPPPGKGQAANEALEKSLREALGALIKDLTDPRARVRVAALEALEKLGDRAAPSLPAVIRATADPNVFVRWAAARTLGVLAPRAPERGVPALTRRLDPSEDLSVQLAAATALQQYGRDARPAIPALIRALPEGGDDDVRLAAYDALDHAVADTPEALAAMARGLSDPNATIRAKAATVLGHIGPAARSTLPQLRKALFDSNDDVRRAASSAIFAIDVAPRKK
jgi:HEAT repeat protein